MTTHEPNLKFADDANQQEALSDGTILELDVENYRAWICTGDTRERVTEIQWPLNKTVQQVVEHFQADADHRMGLA
jgi:hypothetical protein